VFDLFWFLWYSILKVFNFSPLPYPPLPSKGAIIVTGASTGIGQHAAHHLSSLGYLVFAGVRKKEDGNRLISEASNSLVVPIIVDVSSDESVDSAFKEVQKKLKEEGLPLLALVNNAGVTFGSPIEILDLDRARDLFEVNVWGIVRMSQKFLPLLRQSKGRIVNISSIAAEITQPFSGLYSSSKRAVVGINDALRTELLSQGISVSLVLPGAIKSAIWNKSAYPPLPSHIAAIYNPIYSKKLKTREKFTDKAAGPEVTSKIIAKAITSRIPRTHYYAGSDAVLYHFLQYILSPRLIDYIQLNWM